MLQLHQGPQGAHRPHPADARQPARGHRRGVYAGDIVAGVGLQEHHDRRHAVRPRRTRSSSSAWSSPSRSSRSRSSPRPRPTRTSSARRSAALSDEDPTFQVRTDDETGQTIIAGMGELHLEVLVDRMMREFNVDAQRRQAPGRLPRDDHASRSRRSRSATSARPAAAASTATSSSRSSPPGPAAATSSSTRSPAASSPASTSPRSTPASRRRWRAASSPATRSSTSAPGSPTARTTTSTLARWRSRSPGSMAFKEAARQAKPGPARADHGASRS